MTGQASEGGLRARGEELASAGEWSALYDLLSDREWSEILSSPALAYRFAEALYFTGRIKELAAYAAEYEATARREVDAAGLLRALNLAGIAAFELGRVDEARDKFESLLQLAEAEDDVGMLARATNNLGAIANLRGSPHDAIAHYQLAIPLYQRLGERRGLAQTHHNMGISYRDLGLLRDAISAYGEAAALAEEIGYQPLVTTATVARAESELLRGDRELALQLVVRGLTAAREQADPISEAEALRVRALMWVDNGEESFAAALADFHTAETLAGDAGNKLLEAEAARDCGLALLRRGASEPARRHLLRAADLFAALGATAEETAVRGSLEQLG